MTVTALPARARWVWDARDRTRAVRVSAHPAQGLLNLSIWRDDLCVGTVKLRPDEVAGLVSGLTDGLAQLAVTPPAVTPPAVTPPAVTPPPAAGPATVTDLETRLAAVESRLPASRPSAAARLRGLAARVGGHLPSALRGWVPPVHSGG
ncbi:hypothetical protein SAMN05660657_04884 [Geodermatophilus amargosae]|uniref:Uncharacterized protein n=1 Tax=Geodermatophilus amargosae TaxID=1296565 RepID=A0A1I7CU16_9ACTN|nr:hypothetical protein [Geodermatophilus amargosae]SFU02915.1 hypothetical protein SAMN05660657_04884 [Geodermatophilus amargosae]